MKACSMLWVLAMDDVCSFRLTIFKILPTCRLSAACVDRIIEVMVLWLEAMVHVHCLLFALLGLAVPSWGLPSSFMLVSAVTSSQEMCLVGVKEVKKLVS